MDKIIFISKSKNTQVKEHTKHFSNQINFLSILQIQMMHLQFYIYIYIYSGDEIINLKFKIAIKIIWIYIATGLVFYCINLNKMKFLFLSRSKIGCLKKHYYWDFEREKWSVILLYHQVLVTRSIETYEDVVTSSM